MLNEHDFKLLCRRFALSEKAIKQIQDIRSSEPTRRVRSGSKNVSGFFPSRKMGKTIQFESHTLELAGIFEKEHDHIVLEYYDQPSVFVLNYQLNGKNRGHTYRPDFFVICSDWIGWEEWKTERELVELSVKNPNRYCKDNNGRWRCPPAEKFAEQFGLSFRVKSSEDIEWVYQRNVRFLADYLIHETPMLKESVITSVCKVVNEKPGISLEELLQVSVSSLNVGADELYTLIALEKVYVDLFSSSLADAEKVSVFKDIETAKAYSNIFTATATQTDFNKIATVNVKNGERINWDGRGWVIANIGELNVTLLSEEGTLLEISSAVFETLVKRGSIKSLATEISTTDGKVNELMRGASLKDLQVANYRYELIQPYIVNGTSQDRTIRNWLKKFRDAEKLYGNGYVGLLPCTKQQGNRDRKLPEATIQMMDELIINDYETIKQKNKTAVYNKLVLMCTEKGVTVPSFKTFCTAVNSRPVHEKELKRKGSKAAYNTEAFYYELGTTTPRHGDRPFEICHMDHTELDIELVCSKTQRNLGRPWVTFLVDAFSRRILSFYLTFDPPSYRSCMMTLRECVKRHSRFPQTLVVDGGKEFESIYFESLLARYYCIKKKRPGAKPRFGSVCERLFGSTNTRFINNLIGNTQITKNVRQITKEVNPRRNAVWTFQEFSKRLAEWAYEMYDTIEHPALGESPRDSFLNGLARTGIRNHRIVPYDQDFILLTLPSTRKGTAKVEPERGVMINRIYYWSNFFRDPEVEYKQIHVRYDPFDISKAFAFVKKNWVTLESEYFHAFRNRTEKEIQQAFEELRRRNKLHGRQSTVTSKKLADFLRSTESDESLLLQRLKDSEVRSTFQVLDGGKTAEQKSRVIKTNIKQMHKKDTEKTMGESKLEKLLDKLTIYEEF
ncbi:TnsA endonuclease N-terminal domain-containing protein [Brevibacillus porteri]|uniref:TnsA endonuclease N-terminal domain-containing protein n=1 Tax=Brevibacillus porteri TaxID=2126350 RepID=UPI003709FD05